MRELSLHVLDLMENGLQAGASRMAVEITEDPAANQLTIMVTDNGRGMDAETVRRVTDPFFTTRTTRHVGLGIPLLKAAAERCNGSLEIASTPGKGTQVTARFDLDHIDRAPLGDMKSTVMGMLLSDRPCELHYVHRVGDHEFEFDSAEVRDLLGGLPLTHPRIRAWIENYLQEGLSELYCESGD